MQESEVSRFARLVWFGLHMNRLNKKKQSHEDNNKYIEKQIEVGDVVHKIKTKTISKFYEREGIVIEVKDNQSKVLWDKRISVEYEFNSNLKVIRMKSKENIIGKKYAVMLIGKQTPSVIYDTYEEAESEAKRLVMKEQIPAYVLKSVAHIEVGTPKITKL